MLDAITTRPVATIKDYQHKGTPEPDSGYELFTVEDCIDRLSSKKRRGQKRTFAEALEIMSRVEGHEKCGITIMRNQCKHHEGVSQQLKENVVANKIANSKKNGTFDDYEIIDGIAQEAALEEKYLRMRNKEPKYRKVF